MIFTRFVVLLLVFVLFCFRDIPMHHRKRLAGTHVTGQDCWALVSRRPQSIVYTHLHHRAHVYSSSHSPVCERNNIGGGGGGGFFLRTILLTRSRIFWTKQKMFDIFSGGGWISLYVLLFTSSCCRGGEGKMSDDIFRKEEGGSKNYFKVFSNDETRAGRTRKEFHHRIFKFFLFYFVFVVHTGCVRGEVGGKFEFCNSTVDKWNSII